MNENNVADKGSISAIHIQTRSILSNFSLLFTVIVCYKNPFLIF